MIVQEDPFISLSIGECFGSLVVLNRVSSKSIGDSASGAVATARGPKVVAKPVVGGKTPSTGHQAPRPKMVIPAETPGPHIPSWTVSIPDWTGPLKGYLKGLLRLG